MNRRVIPLVFMLTFTIAASGLAQVPDRDPFWSSAEGNNYGTGMIWRDCNNDGYIDVFYSNGNDIVLAENTIYLSNAGTLPASANWLSSNADYSGHCAVGDFDDDGYPDFAVSNFLGSAGFSTANLSNVYMNSTGLPSITPDWYSADSMYTFSCALGDVDGDGDLDLAFATGEAYTGVYTPERLYMNIGGVIQTTPAWQSGWNTASMDVTFGDVDNDGDLDMAVGGDDRGAVVYYNNAGTLESTPSWQATNIEPVNTLIFGDVNGDNWLDLVVAFNNQLGSGGYYRAYLNDGAGNLYTSPGWQSATGGYGSAVAMYDYDNDGDLDLAAGRWWDQPRIYQNTGITFTSTPTWQANPSTVVEELAWVDVDGTGAEMLADTFYTTGRKLFYARHGYLHSVDSVLADGAILGLSDYCYDLVSGWVSLSDAISDSAIVYYKYSYNCDLAVVNWDTYAMVFASGNDPYIAMDATPTVGTAPLLVQFTGTAPGATSWLWRFGDGDSSVAQNPDHYYNVIGTFDVSLEIDGANGWHTFTKTNMITTHTDTLVIDNAEIADGASFTIQVHLKNTHPLHELVLPISWMGDINLQLTAYSTDTCRTEAWEPELSAYDGVLRRAVIQLKPGVHPPLPVGTGPVLNLEFTHLSGSDPTPIDTTTYSPHELMMDVSYATYQPAVVPGTVTLNQGICGDVNGDADGPNIAGLTYLVAYLYGGGAPPPDLDMANVDGVGGINIADLTHLVAYLFSGGPAPDCP